MWLIPPDFDLDFLIILYIFPSLILVALNLESSTFLSKTGLFAGGNLDLRDFLTSSFHSSKPKLSGSIDLAAPLMSPFLTAFIKRNFS